MFGKQPDENKKRRLSAVEELAFGGQDGEYDFSMSSGRDCTRDDDSYNDGDQQYGSSGEPFSFGSFLGDGSSPSNQRTRGRQRKQSSSSREEHFEMDTGRFRDPSSGEFEIGPPPEDYDSSTNRYRAKSGRFKKRSADLYDEPDEARNRDLSYRG